MDMHMYMVLHWSPLNNEFESGGVFPPNDIVTLLEIVAKLLCQKKLISFIQMKTSKYCTFL